MLRFLVVLTLVWVAHATPEPTAGLRVAHGPEEKMSSPDSSSESSSPAHNERFFFGAYSTLSHTLVSYTTSVVYASCMQGYSTAAGGVITRCGGKRRKRWANGPRTVQIKRTSEQDDLSTSQNEQLGKSPLEDNVNTGLAKKFFTVWTKSITTTTLTSYSTDSATTVSLTYYCSAGFIDIPFPGC